MDPTYNFEGRAVLITGAASGMGRATAKAFAEARAAVVLVDRDEDALRSVAQEITGAGGKVITLAGNEAFLKEQPTGRMGRPEELAAAVLWLCSPASSFVLGVALPVDGGFTAH